MNIDFITILEDDYTMKVYDITSYNEELPQNIYAMTLDIISSKIPNGQINSPIDLIAYLRNQQIQEEICTITSETLGLAASQIIPDGVYHLTYNINNSLIRTHTFLVYKKVYDAVSEMLTNVNYNIEIGDYDLSYVGDSSNYDIEKVRLAKTLLDSLEIQSQEPDEVAVNDTLDKLTRLLEIINEDINV